jgi:hypothetical protein
MRASVFRLGGMEVGIRYSFFEKINHAEHREKGGA